ncbi:class I SAM-dependent methyltransferase [Spirosoma daeguense]
MIAAYFRYLSRARDEHSLHSPFLFSLYTQIIRAKKTPQPIFSDIRRLRKTLRSSRQQITVTDLGAGSRINSARQRTVGDIARHSQKPDRFGRLLFRLIQRFEAKNIVDLGTSFGLTTAYLADAAKSFSGKVTTFEGCPETATIAQQNFEKLGVDNVNIIVGNIDETLGTHINASAPIDFVFFDANHRYEPTVYYFETCLTNIHNDTVFVFDDIHWSAEMEQAWEVIKAHPRVIVTVDLFWVGLVFFRKEQPKQHFVLRF